MRRIIFKPVALVLRSVLGLSGLSARLDGIDQGLAALQARPVASPYPVQMPIVMPMMVPVQIPVLVPYLVQAPPPPVDVNGLLHQSRGALLRQMPAGAERLLSAGCAGLWYFEWVTQCYGPVREHWGIEFYTAKPEGLPANVTWIANTAGNMEAVGDASCDLMFSGQNMEHLWADEVAGFMIEAARTIRRGGTLVVDSPNRAITERITWSHPEHTIELTVPEIREMMLLAGFDVAKEAGIWLCRDPRTGRMLPFDPNEVDAEWSQTERLIVARDHPDDSFIWWIEGRRNGAAPDRAGIEAVLARAYERAWPERLQRMVILPRFAVVDGWIVVPPGEGGMVFYGPYAPLKAGAYRVVFEVEANSDVVLGRLEVCVGPEGRVLVDAPCRAGEVALSFTLAELQFGVQFRCVSDVGDFRVRRGVRLEGA